MNIASPLLYRRLTILDSACKGSSFEVRLLYVRVQGETYPWDDGDADLKVRAMKQNAL